MASHLAQRYQEGLRLFNAEQFFECHDVLEEVWFEIEGEEKTFYQGLIQAAVALFHFGEGNLGAAYRMYHSACMYLQPYQPRHQDINVTKFLSDLEFCFQELLEADPQNRPHVQLQGERIPKINLSPKGQQP